MHLSLAISIALLSAGAVAHAAEPASNELPEHVFKLLEQKQYQAVFDVIEPLARQRNQHATYVLANYYVCGRVVEFSCAKAEALFTASLESRNDAPANPEITHAARNEIAWIHAACEQPGFTRDLDKAKLNAMEALRGDFGNPFGTDTLASVVARTGDYPQAARIQRSALAKLAELAKSENVEPFTVDEFKKRLSLYEKGEPAQFDEATAKQNCNALPD